MAVPNLVVGCPVWGRSWCLDVYFQSLNANVDPEQTGLIFVIPPSDTASRDIIYEHAPNFAFVEVLRDKYEQFDREMRRRDNHISLAQARNMLLQHVCQVGPKWFLSWDSDFLVSPGVVPAVMALEKPVCTVWAWLNRKPPQQGQHLDEGSGKLVPVEWNEPVNCTAMRWDPDHSGVALHLDPRDWDKHAQGVWQIDVVLAWQLMRDPAYRVASYGAHPHGEDLPFNWGLQQRGIERWCYGEQPGVHLFDKPTAEREIEEGYPAIMRHAHDKPLAAVRSEPASESLRTIGYFERETAPAGP